MSTRAIIAIAALSAFAPKMPEQCNKMMGKGGTTPSATAEPPPPPPPPPLSATAPPIYMPPDSNPAVTAATTASAPHKPTASEQESQTAKGYMEKKKYKDAKAVLEKKMKAGTATSDDMTMLHDACEKLKDTKCVKELSKMTIAPPTE